MSSEETIYIQITMLQAVSSHDICLINYRGHGLPSQFKLASTIELANVTSDHFNSQFAAWDIIGRWCWSAT